MLKLIVPDNVLLPEASSAREYSLEDFVLAILATDARFNSSARGAFASERIAAVLKGSKPGDELHIETTDGELLKGAATEPTNGYPMRPSRFLASMIRSIDNMQEVKP